mmetsp:Transcript_35981/g.106349  ORF Transcript_35981/g.106349 Transcript_35981/m.106349 type:complete len:183 (+) Transcript_35981:1022-1570(+)
MTFSYAAWRCNRRRRISGSQNDRLRDSALSFFSNSIAEAHASRPGEAISPGPSTMAALSDHRTRLPPHSRLSCAQHLTLQPQQQRLLWQRSRWQRKQQPQPQRWQQQLQRWRQRRWQQQHWQQQQWWQQLYQQQRRQQRQQQGLQRFMAFCPACQQLLLLRRSATRQLEPPPPPSSRALRTP